MKILFIVTQSEFGGAQRFVFEAAQYFAEQGNEVIVAAGEGDSGLNEKLKMKNEKSFGKLRMVSETEPPQCKIKNLKYLKRQPGLLNAILSIKEIINSLKQERPEVLFLCSTTAGILGSVAASIYKKKFRVSSFEFQVIYRIGGWAFRDPRPWWQNKIIIWLEKFTTRLKDKIIVNSEIDRELAIKYKICPPEKIVKIYNGVNTKQLQFLPKDEAITILNEKLKMKNEKPQCKNKNDTIVGCVANFYKTKGLKYLIEAVHLLCSEFRLPAKWEGVSSFKAVIIGDGRERKKLESLIKKYGLEQTVFLVGKIPDAYKYLKAFDVFVLPSLKEGFPWIILEAMAAQTPIVATSVGAVAEIIENEKQGLLAPPKNSQGLAEKIAWLLARPAEAREMADSAREKVEQQFTREKMLSQTEEIIFGK